MANSHVNKLKVVYFIQEYTKIQQQKGIPNTRICENINIIYPISMGTFYNYMGINAKKQLKDFGVNMIDVEKQKDFILKIIPTFSYDFNKKEANTMSKQLAEISKETARLSEQLTIFN